MVVANLVQAKIEEEIVEKGSEKDKQLMKDAPITTYPILEIQPGQYLSTSQAIVSFLVQSSSTPSLLGKTPQEQAEVDQWLQFLSEETVPLARGLQSFSFGRVPCESID